MLVADEAEQLKVTATGLKVRPLVCHAFLPGRGHRTRLPKKK